MRSINLLAPLLPLLLLIDPSTPLRFMTSRTDLPISDHKSLATNPPNLQPGMSQFATYAPSEIHQANTQYFLVLSGY